MVPDRLTSYFWRGDAIHSRSVSSVVLSGALAIPAVQPRLLSDWEREVSRHLRLEPGDVEALPLARARARWPDYLHCVSAMSDWTCALGLDQTLASSDVALMACRGAPYHHDGTHYGSKAFCNLFLTEDKGLDLHFPHTGHRFALARGIAVVFDTGQPHAVIDRCADGYHPADFPPDRDRTQVFLSWELPVEDTHVMQVLQIELNTDPTTAAQLQEEQVWRNGAPARVCQESGRWCQGALQTDPDAAIICPNGA
ncbi:MAG: hypothetical protein K9K38_09195, partial [Rhodoferax sp.]|nr:hypothetical protein [Rhodoferax sp.]